MKTEDFLNLDEVKLLVSPFLHYETHKVGPQRITVKSSN